ncbi:hypothetical protein [Actinoplanes sp. NPDC023714]|uniref:hypothetical protein n=1 Tax=Actinoplanes sp. NPDC023714 TaxID=3154322 RepID=UPI0033C696E4
MTYYWDLEMGPLRPVLARIGRREGLALAIRVIGWTVERMEPIKTVAARDWITTAMVAGREAVAAGRERPEFPVELVSSFGEVQADADDEAGVHSVLTALIACEEAPAGLSGEVVYGILDFCYQAIRDREELPEWNPETESSNWRCTEAIAFEKRCIREARATSI